jgi:hypothetical protein
MWRRSLPLKTAAAAAPNQRTRTNFKQKPFVIVPSWCKSETREAHRNSRHAPESIPADVSRLISIEIIYLLEKRQLKITRPLTIHAAVFCAPKATAKIGEKCRAAAPFLYLSLCWRDVQNALLAQSRLPQAGIWLYLI